MEEIACLSVLTALAFVSISFTQKLDREGKAWLSNEKTKK
jgi:hypothetical protein